MLMPIAAKDNASNVLTQSNSIKNMF